MTGGRRSSHHKAILYGNVWHTTTCLTSKLRELKQTVLGKEPSMVAHVPKHEAEQVEQVVSTSLEQPTHVAKHEPEQVEQVVVSTSLEQSTHVPKQKAEQVEQVVVSTSLEQPTHVPKHEPEQVEQLVSTSLEQSTHVPKHEPEQVEQVVVSTSLEQSTHVPKQKAEQVEQVVVSTSLEQPTHVAKHEPEQVEQVVVSTSLEQSTHVPNQKAEQVEQVVVSTSLEQSTHVPKHEPEQVEQVVSTSLEQSTHVPKHEPEQVEQVVSTSLEQSTQLPKQKAEQVEQVVSTCLEQTLPSKEPSMVAQVPRQELQHRVSEPVLHTPGKRHRSPSPTPVKVVASCFRRLRQKTAVEITLPAECHKELDQLVERHGHAGQGNPTHVRYSTEPQPTCSICGAVKHTVKWETKLSGKGVKKVTGTTCYPCKRACFLLGSPRSLAILSSSPQTMTLVRLKSKQILQDLKAVGSNACNCHACVQ